MKKNIVCCLATLLVLCICGSLATAQTYDWDGDTSSDWGDPTNWEVEGTGLDPGSAPDASTRVEISIATGNTPLIEAGDDFEVGEVRIGRSDGAGLLTMTGGELDNVDNRFRVGSGGVGTFNISGGTLNSTQSFVTGSTTTGNVNVTGGTINVIGSSRDFNMDEGAPGAASNLTMSAGNINVGDVFLVDEDATVDLSGGAIFAVDDLRVEKNAVVTVTGGLLETGDKIRVGQAPGDGGSLFVNGGIVRGEGFESSVGTTSLLEVNGSGLLQFLNSEESVPDVIGYINSGLITTSELAPLNLAVQIVDVGGTDYTQVSIVPEPLSAVLLSLGLLGYFSSRGRR